MHNINSNIVFWYFKLGKSQIFSIVLALSHMTDISLNTKIKTI